MEQGTHPELIQQGCVYARLWASQAGLTITNDGLRAEVSGAGLRMIPLFVGVADTFLDRLALQFVAERFPTGHAVVTQGEIGDRFYLIARGSAEVVETDADGSERRLRMLYEGDHFAEIALLANEPRSATVRTRSVSLDQI